MTSPSNSSWSIQLTRRAQKDLEKHRGNRARISAALTRLQMSHLASQALAGDLAGAYVLHFSVPGKQFRAAYVLNEDQHTAWVFCIAPRENFYAEVGRRYPPRTDR